MVSKAALANKVREGNNTYIAATNGLPSNRSVRNAAIAQIVNHGAPPENDGRQTSKQRNQLL